MQTIHQTYIDGAFVTPHGSETVEIINPTTERPLARATLADAEDTPYLLRADTCRRCVANRATNRDSSWSFGR